MSFWNKEEQKAILKKAEETKIEADKKQAIITEQKIKASIEKKYQREIGYYNARCKRYMIHGNGFHRLIQFIALYQESKNGIDGFNVSEEVKQAGLEPLEQFINELVGEPVKPPVKPVKKL